MAVDRAALFHRLQQLEAAAAAVGELLVDATDEELEEVTAAFAPLRPKGYQARRWDTYWLGWLRECTDRLQPCATTSVSPEASLDLDVSSAATENTPSRSCDEAGALMRPNASEYGPLISPVALNCPAHSADHTGTPGSAQAAENAVWNWILSSVQCSSGSGLG